MLLFRPEHIKPILDGTKCETRRIWGRARVKVGSVHQAKTKMFSKDYFALLQIISVHREVFQSVTEEDARNEGYPSRQAFIDKFFEINPKVDKLTMHGEIPFNVWVVKFQCLAEAN